MALGEEYSVLLMSKFGVTSMISVPAQFIIISCGSNDISRCTGLLQGNSEARPPLQVSQAQLLAKK